MKVVMMSLLMLLLAGGNAEAKKYKPAPRTAKNIVIAHTADTGIRRGRSKTRSRRSTTP